MRIPRIYAELLTDLSGIRNDAESADSVPSDTDSAIRSALRYQRSYRALNAESVSIRDFSRIANGQGLLRIPRFISRNYAESAMLPQ